MARPDQGCRPGFGTAADGRSFPKGLTSAPVSIQRIPREHQSERQLPQAGRQVLPGNLRVFRRFFPALAPDDTSARNDVKG